jgi:hypothetical protein
VGAAGGCAFPISSGERWEKSTALMGKWRCLADLPGRPSGHPPPGAFAGI